MGYLLEEDSESRVKKKKNLYFKSIKTSLETQEVSVQYIGKNRLLIIIFH